MDSTTFQKITEYLENKQKQEQNTVSAQENNTASFSDSLRITNAVIENISTDRSGTMFVTVRYSNCPGCRPNNLRLVLLVTRTTVIRNEQNQTIPAQDLEPQMVIDASYSAAMTKSIPPQAQAFFIRVRQRRQQRSTTTGRIIEINRPEQFLLTMSGNNPASITRFNVTPDTIIRDFTGRTIPFSRLFAGLRVEIEHSAASTASIPPQTTAFIIQVIR